MKTLFIFFASTFIVLSANASLGLKSIELNDSTVINGIDVSAITLNNVDSSVHSVEISTGEVVKGVEIKKINMFHSKVGAGFGLGLMSMRHGGDSGD
jgi:hypothetical protein